MQSVEHREHYAISQNLYLEVSFMAMNVYEGKSRA